MLGATLGAKDYLDRVCREIQRLDVGQMEAFSQLVEDAYHAGKFVFIIGNGGSGANASHLCEDLANCTLRDFENQTRLRVLSLTDNAPWLMAVANDLAYVRVFVEQLKEKPAPRPATSSPRSPARATDRQTSSRRSSGQTPHGMTTLGITGYGAEESLRNWRRRTCTSRSTTWGSSSRSTRSCSTGSSTTSTVESPARPGGR